MKKEIKGILFSLFFIVTGIIMSSLSVQAATHKIHAYAYTNKGRIFSQDMDGNNRKDKIQVIPYKNSRGIKKLVVKVNNTQAISYMNSKYFSKYSIRYFTLDNNERYMQFIGKSSNGTITMNVFFRYNKSSKRFMIAKNFMTSKVIENSAGEVVKAVGNNIYIRHKLQPIETGAIYWDYIYTYTSGAFKLRNTMATAKSCVPKRNDAYVNYFTNSKYITAKQLSFYTNSTCRTLSMVLPKGKVVSLKNIKISNNYVYLRFQYGNKYGWQRVKRSSRSDWFYGVSSRLTA